uniref:LARP4/4B RNA recognition motif domain-containing protein n=1 Tax=Gasterosteus aculeatus aculeatus TaxID=481459 RepID=A0AAQ4PX82_GASAC
YELPLHWILSHMLTIHEICRFVIQCSTSLLIHAVTIDTSSSAPREHLGNDLYLHSQMDNDQYVSIATLASLDKVKSLSTDCSFFSFLFSSTPIVADFKGGKATLPLLLLLLLACDDGVFDPVVLQEVESLFDGENVPKFLSCEFVSNDNWFITFKSETDAQQVKVSFQLQLLFYKFNMKI